MDLLIVGEWTLAEEWKRAKTGAALRAIDCSPHPLYRDTSIARIMCLPQLRTDLSPLDAYLYEVNCSKSPSCSDCGAPFEPEPNFS
jgi:hypothetical protein